MEPDRPVTPTDFPEFAECIVRHVDEVFFWINPGDGRPCFVSPAYERIWGYPCASVYAEPSSWLTAIHPEDRERTERALAQTLTSAIEFRIIRADGQERWVFVRTFPVQDDAAGVQRIIGIAQDCTDRKLGERTRAFLASIVESSEDSIVGTDLDGRIVSWNRGAEKLFGYTAAEALGQVVTLIFPPNPGLGLKVIDKIRRQEKIERFEVVRVAKGGEPIDVSVIISPIRDRTGELLGVSGIYNDMRERKRAEAELLKAKEAAEAASRAKGELLKEIERLNKQLKQENSRMSAELEITQRLQQMMLPRDQELRGLDGLDISGSLQPATEVGGDYYDVLPTEDGVFFSIGDVTGHGLESGVIAIMVQSAVRTLLTAGVRDSQRFFEVLNRVVYDNVRRMGCDRNLTFGLVRYRDRQVRISGQHEEILVIRRDGAPERHDTLDLGFPLGLKEDISGLVGEIQVALHSGDVLVAYTDGITEAVDPAGVAYGLHRLAETVRNSHQKPAEEIREAVLADLDGHIGGGPVLDDISLLVVKGS
jgi:phosphoserine phosphatase RsbU/P